MTIETELYEIFNREIVRELLSEKFQVIDEDLFEDSFTRAKGNCWDAAIIYELVMLMKDIK